MKMIRFLLKQYDIGTWWGALKSTYSNAAVYLSLFNTAMIVPMAYVTWISPWLQGVGLNLPFGLFLGAILIFALLTLLFEYKLSTPSGFSFWSEQFWKHNNPIRSEFEKVNGRMDAQNERLKVIEKSLEQLVERNSH